VVLGIGLWAFYLISPDRVNQLWHGNLKPAYLGLVLVPVVLFEVAIHALVRRQLKRDADVPLLRRFAGLDAFTGQPLDYAGNVITEYALEKFSDMEGHPAREAVELLAATGIVAGVDGKFRPDDPVTQAELITMLVKSSGQFTETVPPAGAGGREPWYRAYYEAAARIGILQPGEKPDPDAAVTRETLARLTVRAMGYQRVAQLSDIYVLNFQDADEIPAYLKGHVALSVALGLIEPVEERFEPGAAVTRAEAATTLVRMLKNGR